MKRRILNLIVVLFFSLSAFVILSACQGGEDINYINQLRSENGAVVTGGEYVDSDELIYRQIDPQSDEGKNVLQELSGEEYNPNTKIYIFEVYILRENKKLSIEDYVTVEIPFVDNILIEPILYCVDFNTLETIGMKRTNNSIIFETNVLSYFVIVDSYVDYECVHDFGEWEVVDEPTCEFGGVKVRKCNKCGAIEEAEVPALEHDLVEYEEKPATCGKAGHKAYEECKNCDYTTYEEIPALEHDLVEYDEEPATCGKAGHKAYEECKNCDYTTYEEIPALEHDLVEYEEEPATCGKAGHKAYEECKNCDYTTYEEIPALEHEYGTPVITKNPTCSEEGTETVTCIHCGDTIENEIAKIDHTFGAWTVTEESTCKDHGTKERTCLVCSYVEEAEAELGDHTMGDWVVTKKPTLEEEGIETRSCTVCDYEEHYPLDKLQGYTVTVSGGTVNRKGENKDQSTIYVAEGEVVEIVAKSYTGYTFYQWFSDSVEIIPTSTFELRVSRNTYFYICFEEALNYGEWVCESQRSCTTDGLYTRTDSTTGLKQFMVLFATGHDMSYEPIYEVTPTCTTGGSMYYECTVCGYKEHEDLSPAGHNFNGEETIVEEAYGAKVGIKEIKCTRCDATKQQEYIKAAYPSGNIKVEYEWNNLSYVSSADREETHWKIDDNKYYYHIVRDASGHSSGTYQHIYIYYEDLGDHSPVYIKRMTGNMSTPQYNQYGTYGWGLAAYVDSFDEFIEYLDDEPKGNDNGLNNTDLYALYERWEEIFNERGCIPSSYECTAITEYLGYTCRVYENDGFYYYVNEDNCCLNYGGKGYNRYHGFVTSIEEITEMPIESVDFDSIRYIMIDIENGNGYTFKDQYYFQIEKLTDMVKISESSNISDRKVVTGWETKNLEGEWVKIVELAKDGSYWQSVDEDFTYLSIINQYFDGIYPECLEIRPILADADLPVHVSVINGYILSTNGYYEYGTENNFLANEEISLRAEYDESKYYIDCWKLTINGEVTEIREDYLYAYTFTLPASGTVIAECVLKDLSELEYEKINITINIVGNGKLDKSTGEYELYSTLTITATPKPGNIFVGWYVNGLFNMGGGEDPMVMSLDEGTDETVDYSEYGEFFGNKYIYNFILDPYSETVVITAVFETIDVTKDYIDVINNGGFVNLGSWRSLDVSALRLSEATYLDIYGTFAEDENITGWTVTEQLEEGPTETALDGYFNGYYFTVDSEIDPIIGE